MPRAGGGAEAPAASDDPLAGNETILLVEDEEAVRGLIMCILRPRGYTVLEARHALDADALGRQFSGGIDLLLTDVVMPHMTGPSLARGLIAVRPALKVVYMSGYSPQHEDPSDVLEPGCTLLQKPFTPVGLLQTVRAALGKPPHAGR